MVMQGTRGQYENNHLWGDYPSMGRLSPFSVGRQRVTLKMRLARNALAIRSREKFRITARGLRMRPPAGTSVGEDLEWCRITAEALEGDTRHKQIIDDLRFCRSIEHAIASTASVGYTLESKCRNRSFIGFEGEMLQCGCSDRSQRALFK